MATIYDVARRAGVSTATVSAVLNRTSYVSPELTKRVREAAKELDYRINFLARSLQIGRTHSIGMLIPLFGTPDPFYAQVVQGVEDVLRKKGYVLILGQTYNDPEQESRYISTFRSRYVDGMLLFQAPGDDPELRKFLGDKPVVFVGRKPEDIQADVIVTDIYKGTRMAVEHLIGKGHKRIGLITVAGSRSVRLERQEGWRSALKAHGLPADEGYCRDAELTSDSGRRATEALLSLEPRPTAIFADNLLITVGVLKALQTSPGVEVEVMSSDDAEWLDVFHLPVSTIVQPGYELGVQAAELLLKRIRHPKRRFETVVLEPALRIRNAAAQASEHG